MSNNVNSIRIADTYWHFLKNLNSDIKIRLIEKLSASLMHSSAFNNPENRTEEFIRKFNGAWVGDESAEEIIKNISEFKSSKEPISFD